MHALCLTSLIMAGLLSQLSHNELVEAFIAKEQAWRAFFDEHPGGSDALDGPEFPIGEAAFDEANRAIAEINGERVQVSNGCHIT